VHAKHWKLSNIFPSVNISTLKLSALGGTPWPSGHGVCPYSSLEALPRSLRLSDLAIHLHPTPISQYLQQSMLHDDCRYRHFRYRSRRALQPSSYSTYPACFCCCVYRCACLDGTKLNESWLRLPYHVHGPFCCSLLGTFRRLVLNFCNNFANS